MCLTLLPHGESIFCHPLPGFELCNNENNGTLLQHLHYGPHPVFELCNNQKNGTLLQHLHYGPHPVFELCNNENNGTLLQRLRPDITTLVDWV